MKCKICENENDNTILSVNAMRLDNKRKYKYLKCNRCGCLQIMELPDDLEKYYNEGYYSYNNNQYNPIKRGLIKKRNEASYSPDKTIMGRILEFVFPMKYDFRMRMDMINKYAIDKKMPIVDIGCGSGHLVDMISDLGYENVSGCDPYISEDSISTQGNHLFKKDIFELKDKYQIIMMIHTLEHISNPIEVVERAGQLLDDLGTLIVEVPIIGYAWEKYGTDWVQLDSPVHLFLNTDKSMRMICSKANMEMVEIAYKGTDYQFRGSELIRQGILNDKQTLKMIDKYPEKKKYLCYAELLNEMKMSDTAIFVMKKKTESEYI